MEGKVAIVTGGAGGIGSAICRRLAEAGATLVIINLDKEKAQELATKLQELDFDAAVE